MRLARIRSRAWSAVARVVPVLCAVGMALARQPADDPADAGPPQSAVHVNDSFEAREELRRVERLIERGRWAEVARRCQRVIDDDGDKLIAEDDGLFVSVSRAVASRVASLPPAGLEAYRAQFEARASAAIKTASIERNIEALLRVAEDYFCTAAGARAAERAADLLAEAGHVARAAALLRRLLNDHPDYRDRPPETLARLAVLLAWDGRLEEARALAEELRESAPEATMLWAGTRRRAIDVLTEQIGNPLRPTSGPAEFSWRTLGGDASRNRVISSSADAGAILWSMPLVSPADTPGGYETAGGQDTEAEQAASMVPCLADGVLCFQNAVHVWSVDLDNKSLRWRYESPDHDRDRDRFRSDRSTPVLYAPAMADDRIYAVLGEPAPGYYGSIAEHDGSELVCLDAEGRAAWRLPAVQLGHEFARVQFNPAPIVWGGKVFLTARRQKTSGFEDCYLVRVDAASGRLDWQVHLGSAAIGGYGYRLPTLSIVALASDTVFACTNLGSVVAVDAWTGRVRWLRRYERVDVGRGLSELPRSALPSQPWEYHPAVCWRDKVVTLPTDCLSLLVVDQADGRIAAAVPRTDLNDPVTLLGVVGDRLLAAGRELACWDLSGNKLLWSRPLPDSPVRGRPAISESSVYWPCEDYLARWNLSAGTEQRTKWASQDMPGNLLLTPEQLIVVSDSQVALLEQKSRAFERLRQRVAAAPADPVPRLDLAEVALRTGDVTAGDQALREAIERAGTTTTPEVLAEPTLRRRLYDACVAYADRYRRPPEASLADAIDWYRRAGVFAPAIREQVAYRLKLAAVLEEADRPTDAIRTYRQLLTDVSLHDYEIRDESEEARPAGQLARTRIARVIEVHGRDAYEPIEREAAALLTRHRRAGDIDALNELVESYPNSRSAADALIAIGELRRERGEYVEAARALTRALTDYPRDVDAAAVIMLIADSHRLAGKFEAALSWLGRGAREHPTARVTPPGEAQPTTFAKLALAWRRQLAVPTQTRPILMPPLRPNGTARLPSGFELLEPLFNIWSMTRRTVYLGYVDGAVACYAALNDEPIWRKPAPCRVRPNLLAMTNDLAVLATKHEVFGLRLSDGQRMWTHGKYPADAENAETDPEWFDSFAGHVWGDGRLVSIQDSNRAQAIDVQTGEAIWDVMLPASPQGPAALNDELFVFGTVTEGLGTVLHVLDAADGAALRTIDFGPREAIVAGGLRFTSEGTLLVTTTRTMSVYDPHRGNLLWQTVAEQAHRIDTLNVGIDGIYVSEDGRRMIKRGLTDGRVLWTSLPVDPQAAASTGISARLDDGHLYVSTYRNFVVVDAQNGRIVREEPALPPSRQHVFRWLAGNCFVAIDASRDDEGLPGTEAVELRARLIPLPGTPASDAWRQVIDLGRYDRQADAIFVGDHVLLIFLGDTVYRWVDATAPADEP